MNETPESHTAARRTCTRVGDAAPMKREKLLVGSAVVGVLEHGGEALEALARVASATVIASGATEAPSPEPAPVAGARGASEEEEEECLLESPREDAPCLHTAGDEARRLEQRQRAIHGTGALHGNWKGEDLDVPGSGRG